MEVLELHKDLHQRRVDPRAGALRGGIVFETIDLPAQ